MRDYKDDNEHKLIYRDVTKEDTLPKRVQIWSLRCRVEYIYRFSEIYCSRTGSRVPVKIASQVGKIFRPLQVRENNAAITLNVSILLSLKQNI